MRLTEKHKQIALLAAAGTLQNKEIAERVGCHPNTVTRALKRPEVRALIDEMQKRMREQTVVNLVEAFDEAAGDAFEKLLDLMESGPPAVSFRAAESVLDRSRTAPKRQIHAKHEVDGGVVHLHIPASKLLEFRSIMLEVADDPSEVPEIPLLNDNEEYVVALDKETGTVVSP